MDFQCGVPTSSEFVWSRSNLAHVRPLLGGADMTVLNAHDGCMAPCSSPRDGVDEWREGLVHHPDPPLRFPYPQPDFTSGYKHLWPPRRVPASSIADAYDLQRVFDHARWKNERVPRRPAKPLTMPVRGRLSTPLPKPGSAYKETSYGHTDPSHVKSSVCAVQ